eukprot:TRINITY_DN14758_c0_g1_i1.p1 TRINITY_DN14758_c0_g1~~TRINITY_DN14758_c0_g1_i1.p1  ORF type:complete len:162 (+),score=37.53 TRINITY_DN14758_c0_g1_i1:83-568(+)
MSIQPRPWGEFGLGPFAVPDSVQTAQSRVQKNINYFKGNYVVVAGAVILVTSLLWTNLLIFLVIMGASAAGLIFGAAGKRFGNFTVMTTHVFLFLAVEALIVFYFTESFWSFIYAGLLAGLIILAHSIVRNPGVGNNVSYAANEVKSGIKNMGKDVRNQFN